MTQVTSHALQKARKGTAEKIKFSDYCRKLSGTWRGVVVR